MLPPAGRPSRSRPEPAHAPTGGPPLSGHALSPAHATRPAHRYPCGVTDQLTATPTDRPDLARTIDGLQAAMAQHDYVCDRALATVLFLGLELGRPVLLEGEAGVGKTEVAKVLSSVLGGRLIRLQCYEGLDVTTAVYEWNYPRQMLEIRLLEARGQASTASAHDIFGPDFLIKRPLLQALESTDGVRTHPAHRRDRSRGRGVRGVPAGDPVRLPGDRARDRHHQGRASAARDPHLQPHA